MNWNNLTSIEQLEIVVNTESKTATIMLFKHSTTCSISAAALNRVERNWKDEDNATITPYYLDLLNHRDVSAHISTLTSVKHESPQVIIVKNGVATYNTSHSGIRYDDIMDNV